MGKERYSVYQMFEMEEAVWLDPTKDSPSEGTCYIVKYKGVDEPFMAMYAAGMWFVKNSKDIEAFCRWPRKKSK